jgi:glycine/D-amino acid oxidase-like deaminating enzyme/nitrite reductase/ring-hydroxylating ferredoxin subunit
MLGDAEKTHSFWTLPVGSPGVEPPLGDNEQCSLVVVGAGIAGLTTAYLAAMEGKSVIVLDDGLIGGGETGRTTAHLSNALDVRYSELARLHGEHGARLAAESHTKAIDKIEQIVRDEMIDCEFERLDGYLFLTPGADPAVLDEEIRAAHHAGLEDVQWVERAPVPGYDTGRCLKFPWQAQFHPLKYLAGLAKAVQREGGEVHAGGCHVERVAGGDPAWVVVQGGQIVRGGAVAVTTGTPFVDLFEIHSKQASYRRYVIGALIPKGSVARALFWDTDHPAHYVRVETMSEMHDVLLVSGENHKSGQAHDTEARFERLEDWARQLFPMIERVEYRWSGQVEEPFDGLAFIGHNPHDAANVYIATGDSGQGMTHGTIAGMLITDLIQNRDNAWATLYDPKRKTLRALGRFAKENLNAAAQYLHRLMPGEVKSVDEVVAGYGAVMRRGMQLTAVYRDDAGEVHQRSAVCPHLGCVVGWNSTEHTWDCPCHGSRFDALGTVIHGPANRDLDTADDDGDED